MLPPSSSAGYGPGKDLQQAYRNRPCKRHGALCWQVRKSGSGRLNELEALTVYFVIFAEGALRRDFLCLVTGLV